MPSSHPYRSLAERAFWKSAVAARHLADFQDLWDPMPLGRGDRVATAGSCFAQHIGRHLRRHGLNYLDLEPAPPVFESPEEAHRHGFGVYSCRYGNIYTTRQLVQLLDEAAGRRTPVERVWTKDGRFYDALRPSVDPSGHDSAETVLALRERHLDCVRELFRHMDVFVFTLGLTETWEHADGTVYPSAPGTIAGSYDPENHRFRNLRYPEIRADLEEFFERVRATNPNLRLLLTVSPVSLNATASGEHVLTATSYSKSVLRAVAGDLAADHDAIHYFPSYEIIATHPSRGMFFEPDLRSVNDFGVEFVMRHFFSGPNAQLTDSVSQVREEVVDVMCDEDAIDRV